MESVVILSQFSSVPGSMAGRGGAGRQEMSGNKMSRQPCAALNDRVFPFVPTAAMGARHKSTNGTV